MLHQKVARWPDGRIKTKNSKKTGRPNWIFLADMMAPIADFRRAFGKGKMRAKLQQLNDLGRRRLFRQTVVGRGVGHRSTEHEARVAETENLRQGCKFELNCNGFAAVITRR